MSEFLTKLITEDIDGTYVRLVRDFRYYSSYLAAEVVVPKGFVCDFESVPIIRGTSKRGGCIHDYLCRIDAFPPVSKQMAATVYREVMKVRDREFPLSSSILYRVKMFCARWIKSTVVRFCFGYWHKLRVSSSYEEVRDI